MAKRKEIYVPSAAVNRQPDTFTMVKTPCGANAKQKYNMPTHLKQPTGGGAGGR